MFNRYWRAYPWWMQTLLFFLTIFTLYSFGSYLVLTLVPKMYHISLKDILQLSPASQPRQIRGGLAAQAISHAFSFAVPGLIFAGFCHPRLREYLGLRAPGNPLHWLLVTGIMLGLVPVFLWGEAWSMQHLHFGEWAQQMQQANDNTVGAFLKLQSGSDLAFLLFALAFLPAIGEEIIFRGILLRLLHRAGMKRYRLLARAQATLPDAQLTMVSPIMFSALAFAFIHFNPHGFVFIFIAGCVLAFIYFLTGSLLCSMWAHFLYNGSQVLAIFLSQQSEPAKQVVQGENISAVYPFIGLAMFAFCFYFLVKKQTPLPADWSDDFKGETPAPAEDDEGGADEE
jgi:membrane protease YdiL (CAAX protease family)